MGCIPSSTCVCWFRLCTALLSTRSHNDTAGNLGHCNRHSIAWSFVTRQPLELILSVPHRRMIAYPQHLLRVLGGCLRASFSTRSHKRHRRVSLTRIRWFPRSFCHPAEQEPADFGCLDQRLRNSIFVCPRVSYIQTRKRSFRCRGGVRQTVGRGGPVVFCGEFGTKKELPVCLPFSSTQKYSFTDLRMSGVRSPGDEDFAHAILSTTSAQHPGVCVQRFLSTDISLA